MKRLLGLAVIVIALGAGAYVAYRSFQSSQEVPQAFSVGNRLGLPTRAEVGQALRPISANVKVYGAIHRAESCAYDPSRDLIVVPNRGAPQRLQSNDAWISLINHDGSVHTASWIGVQRASKRSNLEPPLVLNEPLGSDIQNGKLYVADRDGGSPSGGDKAAVVRWFDIETGKPLGEVRVDTVAFFNDIEVASDDTIYATHTGGYHKGADPQSWQVWELKAGSEPKILIQAAPLNAPNGIAFDPAGQIVVANMGNSAVLTFTKAGALVKTEQAAQTGSDGLVIMEDGTKYVSSVFKGGVSRIRPGQTAELIAENIPSAASMCFDAGANQLVIPMNNNNALAFVPLD